MAQVRSWAGLDVHARSVLAVTVDGASGEMRTRRLSGMTAEVVEFCASLPGPTRVAYEAGPTGYGLARALHAAGIGCVVAAPGKIERPAQDRVKTDQRDAERVLRLLMIDGLHAVRVPSTEEEALRDLIRAREDLRGDLMRARQRLSKLLLRHDIRYEDTASAWTARHRAWLTRIDLGAGGAQATLLDYLGAIDALVIRRDSLEATIAELVPGSPWAQTVARLRCLRGIDTLSAVGLCAEVGDFERFERARAADELPRPGALGEQLRRDAPPGRDHQDRVAPRAPAARRGGLALPQDARPAARRSSAARTASPPTSWRSPGRPSSACTASGGASTASAPSAARSSPSPSRASWPASAGRWPAPTEPGRAPRRLRRRRDQPGHHAREHPRSNYEQPHRGHARSLDSGLSRRNPVLRRRSAHKSLTARRAPARPAAPSTDTDARPQPRASGAPRLTNDHP